MAKSINTDIREARAKMDSAWLKKHPMPADPRATLGSRFKSTAQSVESIRKQRHAAGLIWMRQNPYPIVPTAKNIDTGNHQLPENLKQYQANYGNNEELKKQLNP
ncbi:hypothetical protein [Roseivirga seohaensis]|uniref:hypothetical protein n=1 Tax=Roseivirga seohaensis TaxID=1914963 RepID=UPI003BACAE51